MQNYTNKPYTCCNTTTTKIISNNKPKIKINIVT